MDEQAKRFVESVTESFNVIAVWECPCLPARVEARTRGTHPARMALPRCPFCGCPMVYRGEVEVPRTAAAAPLRSTQWILTEQLRDRTLPDLMIPRGEAGPRPAKKQRARKKR
jgi:hypothetical protein